MSFILQFCSYLHENASYLRPLEQAFKNFQDSIKEESLTTLVSDFQIQCLWVELEDGPVVRLQDFNHKVVGSNHIKLTVISHWLE